MSIITSRKQQEHDNVEQPWDAFYARYWKRQFSDQALPETEIVIVGTRTGELPIHDRWWLSKGSGLRLGTSFNGLGVKQDSELSVLTATEIDDRATQTVAYLNRQKREHPR